MFEPVRSMFNSAPMQRTSTLGAGLSEEEDHRFPAFQQAWKKGAGINDLFGPDPFKLNGSVGRSGADNHRPDVAKVETFLHKTGHYQPMTDDGPTGWHNTNLDTAIRTFQKQNGLTVDGVLKPNGPTIARIGGLLHRDSGEQTASLPGGEWRDGHFKPNTMSEEEWQRLLRDYDTKQGPSNAPQWLKDIMRSLPVKPPLIPPRNQPPKGGTRGSM